MHGERPLKSTTNRVRQCNVESGPILRAFVSRLYPELRRKLLPRGTYVCMEMSVWNAWRQNAPDESVVPFCACKLGLAGKHERWVTSCGRFGACRPCTYDDIGFGLFKEGERV